MDSNKTHYYFFDFDCNFTIPFIFFICSYSVSDIYYSSMDIWLYFMHCWFVEMAFSRGGGDYQNKIHQLIGSEVAGEKILDIGCGSGHLLSIIAKQNPKSELVGIDYWGDNWEYSQELCLNNFRAENIKNPVGYCIKAAG